jgi:general secretion pathway protein G
MMKKILKGQSGFTLIELLIVMLIIAILAIAVAPRFMNLQADAQQRTCQGNQAAMDTAMEIYRYQQTDATVIPTAVQLLGPGLLKGTAAPVCPSNPPGVLSVVDDRWDCDYAVVGPPAYDHSR